MPRPTVAQLAYGSCTVVFSTLAMLLLSRTSSGPAVAVVAVAALALGLLVAMTVPAPKTPEATEASETSAASTASESPAPDGTTASAEQNERQPVAP
ncbi:hypothetical protein JS756_17425 [Streptomyces actuosus]|uniref:Secreted protein n=1 Tax=Streptomyces actuosus TaxID=1885 RepID=A0ABS2VRV0_STRAS|nr:hypothetical protein [Streptomyces actuosus]MBN0045852.1 hypothetical protein [Streptomyces actuosus]